ncbi:MAG TPA: ATP-dependent DNA helicase, partial [Rhizobacter sp.]|nr:ATP-dependent DNA helicase [Rhizobacter sp.]
ALRKRFCRQFNFELQAAATEDAIQLALSTAHSFPLDEVARYLHSNTALDVLVQALLDAPLFGVRWRWNATVALALPRFAGGRKVAPQLQRMKSEDLLAAVFPDQVACAENLAGPREVPEHPLVAQTLHDCLYEAMDAEGWLQLLRRMESGEVTVLARDLPGPSPLAAEALTARPYAYLDDAPIEERRAQAVQGRRYTDPESPDDLGQLDAEAIAGVREEAWPSPRHADEMHEALTALGVVTHEEALRNEGWTSWLDELAQVGRATLLSPQPLRLRYRSPAQALPGFDPRSGPCPEPVEGSARAEGDSPAGLWVAAERLAPVSALYPEATLQPAIEAPAEYAQVPNRDDALTELLRSRLSGLGPVTVAELARQLQLPDSEIELGLLHLQREGSVMQGRFTPGTPHTEWCERHLLARIHRYTLKRLRREIEPVEPRDFVRFLFEWQHVSPGSRVSGPEALAGVLSQLEGYEAPAAMWEAELLPARVKDYSSAWLDDLCTAGRTLWTRLRPMASEGRSGSASLRTTPILLLPRRSAAQWSRLAPPPGDDAALGSRTQRVAAYLAEHGASFFDEIAQGAHLLRAELEDALSELVVRGRVNCDSYAGLRALLVPAAKRATAHSRHRRRVALFGVEDAGRWTLIRGSNAAAGAEAEALEHVARTLLRRYGVVSWRVLEREAAWLPPWRELVRVYRRLEARGEIRGGRFIAGQSGEQFALPDAIALMRQVRRQPADESLVCLAATDPANLLGTVLPGPKLARVAGSRVLYRAGLAVATSVAGQVEMLVPLTPAEQHAATRALALDPAYRWAEAEPAEAAVWPV